MARVTPAGWNYLHSNELPTDARPSQTQTVPQRACRSAWARLIAKVYEIEKLICPRCGSAMRLIGVIIDPCEVRKILHHPVKFVSAR